MQSDQLLITLWRRKWIIVLTAIVATTASYFVSAELPKVYSASATLFVGDRVGVNNDFEAIQSAQVLAKTYAELIQSRNVATEVALALPGELGAGEILERMTFRPVRETQLIVVSAEGDSPTAAIMLANTYASVFADYARDQLEDQTNGTVAIADRAQTSGAPIRPQPVLYSAIMLVLSLFLGAGLALLRDRLDTRLRSEDGLSAELGVPVLGRAPAVSRRRMGRAAKQGFSEERFLEAFRVLRTNLAFLSQEPMSRFVVASSAPGEGKSTCAMALAQVIGEQSSRVIVIEGDLRRPSLAASYGIDRKSVAGVTHYLALGAEFEDVVHETAVPMVYLIPAGAIPPNPSTLLNEQGVEKLVRQASAWADFVIVDSPPLSAGADASILAHVVGNVLFVVNRRRSVRSHVFDAVARLRQAEASIAGFVVNEVPPGESYSYYGDRPTDKGVVPRISRPTPGGPVAEAGRSGTARATGSVGTSGGRETS